VFPTGTPIETLVAEVRQLTGASDTTRRSPV
jgi:hypothetical protein